MIPQVSVFLRYHTMLAISKLAIYSGDFFLEILIALGAGDISLPTLHFSQYSFMQLHFTCESRWFMIYQTLSYFQSYEHLHVNAAAFIFTIGE